MVRPIGAEPPPQQPSIQESTSPPPSPKMPGRFSLARIGSFFGIESPAKESFKDRVALDSETALKGHFKDIGHPTPQELARIGPNELQALINTCREDLVAKDALQLPHAARLLDIVIQHSLTLDTCSANQLLDLLDLIGSQEHPQLFAEQKAALLDRLESSFPTMDVTDQAALLDRLLTEPNKEHLDLAFSLMRPIAKGEGGRDITPFLPLFEQAINGYKALIVEAPEDKRAELLESFREALPKTADEFNDAKEILADTHITSEEKLGKLHREQGIHRSLLELNVQVADANSSINDAHKLISDGPKEFAGAMRNFLVTCPSHMPQREAQMTNFAFLSALTTNQEAQSLFGQCQARANAAGSSFDMETLIRFNLGQVDTLSGKEFDKDDKRSSFIYTDQQGTPREFASKEGGNFDAILQEAMPGLSPNRANELKAQLTQASWISSMLFVQNENSNRMSPESHLLLTAASPDLPHQGIRPASIYSKDVPKVTVQDDGENLRITSYNTYLAYDMDSAAPFTVNLTAMEMVVNKEKLQTSGLAEALVETRPISMPMPIEIAEQEGLLPTPDMMPAMMLSFADSSIAKTLYDQL